jgi:homoserine O-acetyltransferase
MSANERRELWWPSPTTDRGAVVHASEGLPFVGDHGGSLPEVQFSYQTWGELDADGSNAVLVVHPMTVDCHVTSNDAEETDGWWEPIVGPGRAIDTRRYFVVCPNILGGCYGTTGPRFPAPDGDPWLERFPLLTPRDMMRAQKLFLRSLGIERLAMVIGPSMGGMVAWEWAIEGGDAVDTVIVVAAPLATTPQQIAWNWLQRRGIELDIGGDEASAKWGQMIARGIGMVSYRSPVGLVEKFGRKWFKRPGATLGERGMYNVESWLRHHGKRIAKRFDPYTWILYSRAMDLHDVGEGRNGTLAALDEVRCRTVVVGISTDNLYPAADVHLGADILRRLDRDARYAEIRSPHGHDAFLLESDQLDAILRETLERAPRLVVPTDAGRARPVRVGVLGHGDLADSFERAIAERHERLRSAHGLAFELAVTASLDEVNADPALIQRSRIDALVDLTRSADSREIVARVLRAGVPVATPNKALIFEHGDELEALAHEHSVRLAYHNSVASGSPLIFALDRAFESSAVRGLRAILSASSNVVLDELEIGATYDEALGIAVGKGLTLSGARLHITGWESAQKLLVLMCHLLGERYAPGDIAYRGIEGISPALVAAAPKAGFRVRLVALCRRDEFGSIAGVLPLAVPVDGHLGHARRDANVAVVEMPGIGEIVHQATGRSPLPTISALLGDLIGLFEPSQSWTALYPRANTRPRAPEFSQHLTLREGRAVVTDEADAQSVPLLKSLISTSEPGT